MDFWRSHDRSFQNFHDKIFDCLKNLKKIDLLKKFNYINIIFIYA
jgi:hypothetical protein